MTTRLRRSAATARQARPAASTDRQTTPAETVTALHEQWVALLGRMTSGGLSRPSHPAGYEMRKLAAAVTGLESRIAATHARTIAEVLLKLHMAGSAGTLTKSPARLVDSAAGDLQNLEPAFRLDG